MEHEPSGAMLPPLNERLVVPTPPTDPPQPLANRLSKVRLANAAPRSSLKATCVSCRAAVKVIKGIFKDYAGSGGNGVINK